ncbi:hypothetical protein PENTCL1PPCAC_23756 [Pristionchus entomophagus]|uniref:Target of rapamycin complex subunit lst8 n=1 Tax=Pristionchus entomophagus TaxID=358040 RepID=A0AAV5U477_9BILA|nr:hypothetical protein PENTCL1PPCAC_23756 [Pristionchus entomophagus]
MNTRSFAVSASYDPCIKIWDLVRGKNMATIPHPESQINCLAMTENGSQIGVGSWQRVAIFDAETMAPSPLLAFEQISKNVTAVGFQSEGRWMFTGGEDETCRIFDMRGATQLVCQRMCTINSSVQSVVLHPNQCELFFSDSGGAVYSWDLRNGTHEPLPIQISPSHFVTSLAIHPTGHMLFGVTSQGKLLRWNLMAGEGKMEGGMTGEGSRTLPPSPFPLYDGEYALSCNVSPDGRLLSISSSSTRVLILDSKTLETEIEISIGASWIWNTAFCSDSSKLLMGGERRLHLVDVTTSRPLMMYEGHAKPITALAIYDHF